MYRLIPDPLQTILFLAAILEPGDKIMAMRLDQGGHLTHGSPANWLSKFYNHVFYGVDDSGRINYEELEKWQKGTAEVDHLWS